MPGPGGTEASLVLRPTKQRADQPAGTTPLLDEEPKSASRKWRDKLFSSIGPVWIMCAVTSYTTLTLVCRRWLHNPDALAVLRAEVPRSVQERSATMFCTALAIDIINLLFEGQTTKLDFVLFPALIKGLASSTNLLTLFGKSVLGLTPGGRVILVQRYICWMHTTPSILMLMKLISTTITTREAMFAIACDEAMIITGVLASLSSGWALVFWTIMTHVTFLPVFPYLHKAFNEAISETKHGSIRITMWMIYGFMMVLWTAFAINWDLAALGWISTRTEEVIYLCCDFSAKVLFSSTLMLSSFKGMEARREVAMRSIEEGSKQKLIGELRRLLEQKERFLSSVSHELRTPLNGIIGISEGMLSGCCGVLAEQVRHQVYIMRTSGARLLTLINDVMDASALRQNTLVLKRKQILLRQIVDDVLDLSRCLVDRRVELRNMVPPRIAVLGDADCVVQILNNLLGNAAKFTQTGHIKVSARMVDQGRKVAITVADTGIGMAHSTLATVFLPFEQVDASIVRKYGGFGLGLNIVQELVKAHDGEISVDSAEGRGTRFTFTLPSAGRTSCDVALEGQSGRSGSGNCLEDGSSTSAGTGPCQASGARRIMAALSSAAMVGLLAMSRPRNSHGGGGTHSAPASPALTAGPASATAAHSGALSAPGLRRRGAAAAAGGGRAWGSRASMDSQRGLAPLGEGPRPSSQSAIELEAQMMPTRVTMGSSIRPPEFDGLQYNAAELSALASSRPYDELMQEAHTKQTAGTLAAAKAKARLASAESSRARVGPLLMSVSHDEVHHAELRSALADMNVQVLGVPSGEAALQLLENCEELPDCVLLDVALAGGLGAYEVVHQIRTQLMPATHIPLVMVLPADVGQEEDVAARCLDCGADDFIQRPLQRDVLLASLGMLFGHLETTAPAGNALNGGAGTDAWTILCIDDDAINQLVVQGMLRAMVHRRCRYISATSATSGLAFLKSDAPPPDLVLLDTSLPDISGLEACRRIRERYTKQQVPIIMLSSRHSAKGVEEGLSAGANDYLTKPLRRWELQARIGMQLQPKLSAAPSLLSTSDLFHRDLSGSMAPPAALLPSAARSRWPQAAILVASISDYATLCRALTPQQLRPVLGQLTDAVARLVAQFGLLQVDGGGEGSIALLLPDPSSGAYPDCLVAAAVRMYQVARLLLAAAGQIVLPGTTTPLYLQLCVHVANLAACESPASRELDSASGSGARLLAQSGEAIRAARQYSLCAPLTSLLVTDPAATQLRSAGYSSLCEFQDDSYGAGDGSGSRDSHDSVGPTLWLAEFDGAAAADGPSNGAAPHHGHGHLGSGVKLVGAPSPAVATAAAAVAHAASPSAPPPLAAAPSPQAEFLAAAQVAALRHEMVMLRQMIEQGRREERPV